jgi:polyribonucleotide nucleotidyltransferase
MASVCGGCCFADAGVPFGIHYIAWASSQGDHYAILSDILGEEDFWETWTLNLLRHDRDYSIPADIKIRINAIKQFRSRNR